MGRFRSVSHFPTRSDCLRILRSTPRTHYLILAIGANSLTSTLTCAGTVPYGFSTGTRYVGVLADTAGGGQITESDETDNKSSHSVFVDSLHTVEYNFESGTLTGFVLGGAANWTNVSSKYYQGSRSASAPASLGDSQSASLFLNNVVFSTAKQLTFYYAVDSEACCDKLFFYVNGLLNATLTNSSGVWASYSTSFVAGTYSFEWRYSKDSSVSTGADVAWVDYITY